MKSTMWTLLTLMAVALMLAACPRDNGAAAETKDAAAPPPGKIADQAPPEGMGEPPAIPEDQMKKEDMPQEKIVKVMFETTKGNILLGVHPDWSPLGAEHFIELVNTGFYNGAPWFRVINGFVAQCGISADPAMNEEWMNKTIQDEPVVQGNLRGFVAFGKSGMPNSRSTHIFINYADNTKSLDPQGFSCFAEVIEGMDVVDQLYRVEWGDQGGLAVPGGLEKFKTQYPDADYILKAYIVRETTPPAGANGMPVGAPGEAPGEPPAPPAEPPAAPEGGM